MKIMTMTMNTKKNAEIKQYHENGQLYQNNFYIDNKINGECNTYHMNGQLLFICSYIDDKKVE